MATLNIVNWFPNIEEEYERLASASPQFVATLARNSMKINRIGNAEFLLVVVSPDMSASNYELDASGRFNRIDGVLLWRASNQSFINTLFRKSPSFPQAPNKVEVFGFTGVNAENYVALIFGEIKRR